MGGARQGALARNGESPAAHAAGGTLQAYFLMKPPGGATTFPASSLEPRRRARGLYRVQGRGNISDLKNASARTVDSPEQNVADLEKHNMANLGTKNMANLGKQKMANLEKQNSGGARNR